MIFRTQIVEVLSMLKQKGLNRLAPLLRFIWQRLASKDLGKNRVTCDCAHACTFEEQEDGTIASKCYCHSGFVLSEDQKSCEPSKDTPTTYTIVRVTPPSLTTEVQPEEILSSTPSTGEEEKMVAATDASGRFIGLDSSPLPTGADGSVLVVEEVKSTSRPTDSSGRELPMVVGPDGVPLKVNDEGELIDANENPITIDEEGVPRDPYGKELPRNKDGAWIYPLIDKSGRPLPVDENNMPVIKMVDVNGNPIPLDASGHPLESTGLVISTDSIGRPLDSEGHPYPINEDGFFVIEPGEGAFDEDRPRIPLITVDGEPVRMDEEGHYVDSKGSIIPTNEKGVPVDERGEPLKKNEKGDYVLPVTKKDEGLKPTVEEVPSTQPGVIEGLPTDESGQLIVPIVRPDGSSLPTDAYGNFVTEDGSVVERDEEGRPLGPDGKVLPTDDSGNYVYPLLGPDGKPLPTDEHRRPIHPVLNTDGVPLPTDESGRPLGKDGKPVPTDASGIPLDNEGQPLPTDSSGSYVAAEREVKPSKEFPTDESGNVIYPIKKADGSPLPTDASGNYVTDDGSAIEKDEEGRPVGPDGEVLPTDETGNYIYPVLGPDGSPLPTDEHQ
ncbi:unnamed protein product, partial [Strongylus vulgaris]